VAVELHARRHNQVTPQTLAAFRHLGPGPRTVIYPPTRGSKPYVR
jgi:hypothetical protein